MIASGDDENRMEAILLINHAEGLFGSPPSPRVRAESLGNPLVRGVDSRCRTEQESKARSVIRAGKLPFAGLLDPGTLCLASERTTGDLQSRRRRK